MDTVDPTVKFPGVDSPNGDGPPVIKGLDARFAEAFLAETVATELLQGRFIWVTGLGWLAWDGRRWAPSTQVDVREAVRQYMVGRFQKAAANINEGGMDEVNGWKRQLGAGKINAILNLAQGLVSHHADELDADPDLLNTPGGVVNLRTGNVLAHDPEWLQTKITKGSYHKGMVQKDWTVALEALHPPERAWLQARIGQAITGKPTPDGLLPICQGSGENGKSAILTDGLIVALGDYAKMASTKLLQGSKNEHPTERAELRGQRLLVAEELTEGRSIDVTSLKQIQDVGQITARYIRQDNFTFSASHSLFATTNYVPVINEVDHGTWRRLALVRFPFSFRKAHEPLESANDRRADEGLKERIKDGRQGQHDAATTWAIEGAVRWHTEGMAALRITERIANDTRRWRADADRILGFWEAVLVPDRNACVITTELRDEFNAWLRQNGHNEWSKELFGPRFLDHAETVKHGVDEAQPRSPKGLQRRPGAWGEVPDRPRIYRGVRYRTASDQDERESGTTGTTESAYPHEEPTHCVNRQGRSSRATETKDPGRSPIEEWLRDRCLLGRFVARNADLYADYRGWCGETDSEAVSSAKFLARLRKLGHVAVVDRCAWRVGITLKPQADPNADITESLNLLRKTGLLARRSRSDGDGGVAWRASLSEPLSPPRPFREEDWDWVRHREAEPVDFEAPEPLDFERGETQVRHWRCSGCEATNTTFGHDLEGQAHMDGKQVAKCGGYWDVPER